MTHRFFPFFVVLRKAQSIGGDNVVVKIAEKIISGFGIREGTRFHQNTKWLVALLALEI